MAELCKDYSEQNILKIDLPEVSHPCINLIFGECSSFRVGSAIQASIDPAIK